MKQLLLFFMLFFSLVATSQEENIDVVPAENRAFNEDLKSKYNGSDFTYTEYEEPIKEVEKKKPEKDVDLTFFKSVVDFLATIFPYALALIVILIIVKSVLSNEVSLWDFSRNKTEKVAIVAVNDEEDIHKNDYLKLLEKAKQDGDYRKATKYYYLHLLKKMNEKELINFDKDKTNSEYIFDLKKTELRKPFSYLLYLYDYVWYGEFNIDQTSFTAIEKKYQSFLNTI